MPSLKDRLMDDTVKNTLDEYLKRVTSSTKPIKDEIEALLEDPINYYSTFAIALELTQIGEGASSERIGAPTGVSVLPASYRLLIALSDGQVLYDSSKTKNKAANIGITSLTDGKPMIGESHGTRIEIMTAALSPTGIGKARRTSSTTLAYSNYVAMRVGPSSYEAIGFIRLSLEEAG
jgi:hypothetical protein